MTCWPRGLAVLRCWVAAQRAAVDAVDAVDAVVAAGSRVAEDRAG